MQVLILAACVGKRLRPITEKILKCLVEVNGMSFIINQLKGGKYNDWKKMLFSPGPVITSERVKSAALNPDICHRGSIFEELSQSLRNNIVKLFKGNREKHTAVIVSGSGTASNETIISFVSPDDGKVLFHLKKPPSLKVVMVCAWHG